MDPTLNTVLSKIFGTYSMIVLLLGTLFNGLIFIICIRKSLRKTSTFNFLAILALSDTFSLFEWNLNHFTLPFFNVELTRISFLWCRMGLFSQHTFLQFSAWILVSIAIDRLFSTLIKKWKFFFAGIKPFIWLLVLLTIFICVNVSILIRVGYTKMVNGTEKITCHATYENDYTLYGIISEIHLYLYSICPFTCLTLINAWLIYITVFSKMNKIGISEDSFKRKLNMTKTVLILNFQFIVLTLPSAIVSGFYYFDMIKTDIGTLALFLCDNLAFSFHSFSIFTLYLTNKRFKHELKVTFGYNEKHENLQIHSTLKSNAKKDPYLETTLQNNNSNDE